MLIGKSFFVCGCDYDFMIKYGCSLTQWGANGKEHCEKEVQVSLQLAGHQDLNGLCFNTASYSKWSIFASYLLVSQWHQLSELVQKGSYYVMGKGAWWWNHDQSRDFFIIIYVIT